MTFYIIRKGNKYVGPGRSITWTDTITRARAFRRLCDAKASVRYNNLMRAEILRCTGDMEVEAVTEEKQ